MKLKYKILKNNGSSLPELTQLNSKRQSEGCDYDIISIESDWNMLASSWHASASLLVVHSS